MGTGAPVWPHWQRVLFRLFFVYLVLQIAPWDWFHAIPGVPLVLRYYDRATDWAVRAAIACVVWTILADRYEATGL